MSALWKQAQSRNSKINSPDSSIQERISSASSESNVQRQIVNILMLLVLPSDEINNAYCDIIENLSNIHKQYLKLTDYVLHTYIEEALYSRSFWNLFDLIEIRPKMNNHVESYHGQLNFHCPTHPNLWSWVKYIQETVESVIIRLEEEQTQKRSTRPRSLTSVNK